MLKFANGFLNKKALKRALKEIELEDSISEQLSKMSVVPEREYKTEEEAEDVKKLKLKGALSKPQTEAVDLKHFKDWRTVDKVESKNPPYVPKSRKTIFDDEDDGAQPAIESPIQTNKNSLLSKIESMNSGSETKDKDIKKDTNFSSFFAEKYQSKQAEENKEFVKEEKTPIAEQKTSVKTTKTTLNDLLKNQKSKQQEQNSEKVVKVEVVDFSEKKEDSKDITVKQETKKVVNRKPRGKNKRRFDADVISSVDWK